MKKLSGICLVILSAVLAVLCVSALVPGDVTGDGLCSNDDMARLIRRLAGWDRSEPEEFYDIDRNGRVSNRDAILLSQALGGWGVVLPNRYLRNGAVYCLTTASSLAVSGTTYGVKAGETAAVRGYVGDLDQLFRAEFTGTDTVRLVNMSSGLCLSVKKTAGTGADVCLTANDASYADEWRIGETSDGLTLRNTANGLYLSTAAADTASGVCLSASADRTFLAAEVADASVEFPRVVRLAGRYVGDSSCPALIKYQGVYYNYDMVGRVRIKKSNDLVTWAHTSRPAFYPAKPDWIVNDTEGLGSESIWAPNAWVYGDEVRLYYCVSSSGSQNSAIGLAKASTPEGPFTDEGMLLRSYTGGDYNCIDPRVFVEDDGSAYLVFGSYWEGIYMRKLDPATGHLDETNTTLWHLAKGNHEMEAASIVKRDGYYYLFVAMGNLKADQTYHLSVGRSTGLFGPYVDKEGRPMLNGYTTTLTEWKPSIDGVAHGEVFLDDDGTWYFASESWDGYDPDQTNTVQLSLTTLVFTEDGWPVSALSPDLLGDMGLKAPAETGSVYAIRNGRDVALSGQTSGTIDGETAVLRSYEGDLDQLFRAERNGTALRLRNMSTGLYLAASAAETGNLFLCEAGKAGYSFEWLMTESEGGFLFRNADTGAYLSDAGAGASASAIVTYDVQTATAWTFAFVADAETVFPENLRLTGQFTGDSSTPCIVKYDGTYYNFNMVGRMRRKTSLDLFSWRYDGAAFTEKPLWSMAELGVSEANVSLKAPTVWQYGDVTRLYYYCIASGKNAAIGMAHASSPAEMFTDDGMILRSSSLTQYTCVDPFVFVDEDGQAYLLIGSGKIYLIPLDPATGRPTEPMNATLIAGGTSVPMAAPTMLRHDGYYYLIASTGSLDGGTNHLVVGRSRTLTGPYKDANGRSFTGVSSLIKAANEWKPGIEGACNGEVFFDGGQWFFISESWVDRTVTSPKVQLHISRIAWNSAGWPVFSTAVDLLGELGLR